MGCKSAFHVRCAGAAAVLLASSALAQTRIEETHVLAVAYDGTWYVNVNLAHSGGAAVTSADPGAHATVQFTGTGIRWIGYRDEWSGIAGVSIDGAFVGTVDTYVSPSREQAELFVIDGLPDGPHTLAVQVLGTHGPASGGDWIWVDAFDVLSGSPTTVTPPSWNTATRVEQDDVAVTSAGTWYPESSSIFSGGSAEQSVEAGASATLPFQGTGVRWIGYRDEWSGIARVWLDGSIVALVDTYASPSQAQAVLFSTSGLAPGAHTIAVEALHKRNAFAQKAWVWVDAFDVLP